MVKHRFILAIIALVLSTRNSVAQHQFPHPSHDSTSIMFDSIYPGKNYRITLAILDSINSSERTPNTLFSVTQLSGGQYKTLFSDSIFSKTRNVEFADFNNDHMPDILVQNISDVRSNWTYYLYLVDTVQNKIKKIKGLKPSKTPPTYRGITLYRTM